MVNGPRMMMGFRVAARAAGPVVRFSEHTVVRLAHDVEVGADTMPAGSSGIVVGAYSDGDGYEIEFEAPFHAVVTLAADDLLA